MRAITVQAVVLLSLAGCSPTATPPVVASAPDLASARAFVDSAIRLCAEMQPQLELRTPVV